MLSWFVLRHLMYYGCSSPPSVPCCGSVWSEPHLLHEPRPAWSRCWQVVNAEHHSLHVRLSASGHLPWVLGTCTLVLDPSMASKWPALIQGVAFHEVMRASWGGSEPFQNLISFHLASLGAPHPSISPSTAEPLSFQGVESWLLQ